MITITIVVILSAGFSFLCSLMEAALYSVPMSKIQALIEQRVAGAKLLLSLRERVDEPISAILTFNTIANSIGATILGGLVGAELGAEYVLLSGILFAILILLFSEIIPKTLGVIYADTLAPKLAYIIRALIIVLKPLVSLSIYVTSRIRKAGEEKETVTKEDLIVSARIAAAEGVILPDEGRWVENALRLNDKTAHQLMTPRTVVYLLPAELPLSQVSAHSEHWVHSRLPIVEDNNPDKVVGIVFRREIFDAMIEKEPEELERLTLRDLGHTATLIPEAMRGPDILRRLLETREHLFIVSNEHGGLEGVITLEDVIEDLLGEEIVDEHDKIEDMQAYARQLAERRRGLPQRYVPADERSPAP